MAFAIRPVTIVMYHYIRDFTNSRYPAIKGLTPERFEGQIDYIEKYYSIIGFKDLLAAKRGEVKLPPRPCILTFDDGLMDHYNEVMPRLMERGVSAMFFPVTEALNRKSLLEVHKLHFILASIDDDMVLLDDLIYYVREHGGMGRSDQLTNDFKSFQNPRRFDSKAIAFIKQQLQHALPLDLRSAVLDALYKKNVDVTENVLASELYLTKYHLKTMVRCGMEVGGHGKTHRWLNHLNNDEQRIELTSSLLMLKEVGAMIGTDWILSYPFSGYNDSTKNLLKEMKCSMALTIGPGLVNEESDSLQMSRLDTNDLPFTIDAPISEWTRKVI